MTSEDNTDAKISFRTMTADDTESLCDCVRICYGDTYFVDDFYNPDKLSFMVNEGLLNSHIAVTQLGEVAGHLGLTLEHSGDITADTLAAMVTPEYRGHRILYELGTQLMETYERLGLVGLQLYALAVHSIVQGQSTEAGGVETGILLGHFPSNIEIEGFQNPYEGKRVAAVLLYFPLHPAPPQTVYVPERYRNIIDSVYRQLNLDRTIRTEEQRPAVSISTVTVEEKSRQGVARIRVDRPGSDLKETITRFKERALARSIPVLYVDLPIADSVSASFIENLRSLQFCYGGVVVERSGSDFLRMQFVEDANINPGAIVLARQHGRDLLNFILSDRH